MRRDGHQTRGDQEQHRVRAPHLQVERLEAAEADRAHHQQRRRQHHRQCGERRTVVGQAVREQVDRRREHASCGRTRHPDEVALVSAAGTLHVEACQAQHRSAHEEESGEHTQPSERREPPGVGQDRRRDTERDRVGQRVELHAEFTRGAREPRDAAVEHVEHDRDADVRRSALEVAAQRVDDARVAAEHVAHGEETGQQGDAAPQARALVVRSAQEACAGVDRRWVRGAHRG